MQTKKGADPFGRPGAVPFGAAPVIVALDELLAQADVVSLHVAAEMTTGPLFGAAQLAMMKPTALLINTARGALVDEAALATALRDRQIAGAGLDAFVDEPPVGSPLLELDNVIFTAHLGGRTVDAQRKQGEMCRDNTAARPAG